MVHCTLDSIEFKYDPFQHQLIDAQIKINSLIIFFYRFDLFSLHIFLLPTL